MAVKIGYKQTEVGVIPEEWEVSNLKGVSLKITDGDHVTPRRELNGYYLLSARNVLNGRIDVSDVDYVGVAEYRRMKHRCGPEPGDILISCSGTIGRIAVVPPKFECVLVRSAALVKVDKELADGLFLQFWLQGEKAQGQIASSVNQGAQPNLFLNHIERLVCPIPPLPEQRAIATALSDLDRLLDGLDRLIAKKRNIKQAVMHQLLTGKTQLPGFNVEWEVKRLGDVASLSKGTQLHSSETVEGGRFAHLNGGITPSSYTHKSNTAGNTIAISEGGNSCGFVQFMAEPYWCGGHCYSAIPNGVDNHFLYQALKGQQASIMGLRVGSGLPNVQKSSLLNFNILLPLDLAEQAAIGEVLTEMDAELAVLEQRREKTSAIKQGMMQQLLTGKVRLV